jgi:adenylate kinase
MITIQDLKSKGFAQIKVPDETARATQVAVAKYIDTLASQSGTNIAQWDMRKFFDGDKFIEDKNKINQIFFTARETELAAKPVVVNAASLEKIRKLEASLPALGMKQHEDLKKEILDTAAELARRQAELVRYARELQIFLDTHTVELKYNLAGQVEKLVASGMWNIHSVGEETISLTNANDVIVRYKSQAQGIDVTVNFGKFMFNFNAKRGSVEAKPYEKNKKVANAYHPHIYGYGICWGAAATKAQEHMARLQMVDLFNLISSILISYNPKDAYADIVRYHALDAGKQDPYVEAALQGHVLRVMQVDEEAIDDPVDDNEDDGENDDEE